MPLSAHREIAFRALWRAQQGVCGICGGKLTKRFGSTNLSLDHVWPKSRGAGDMHRGNLTLVHLKCNQEKGARLPTGCEIIMLFSTNRALGYSEDETDIWDRL